MKTPLGSGVSGVKKAFDGVRWAIEGSRAKVDCTINVPMTAMAQDTHEFEGVIVDESSDTWGTKGKHLGEMW